MMSSHSDSEHVGCGGYEYHPLHSQHSATSSVTILGQGCTSAYSRNPPTIPWHLHGQCHMPQCGAKQTRHALSGLQGAPTSIAHSLWAGVQCTQRQYTLLILFGHTFDDTAWARVLTGIHSNLRIRKVVPRLGSNHQIDPSASRGPYQIIEQITIIHTSCQLAGVRLARLSSSDNSSCCHYGK